MSRTQHKKRNFNDSSEVSDDHNYNSYERGQCFEQGMPCIICPPCDYREKYESEFSDLSCPDFSALCEDKPKICCEKKESGKKSNNKFHHASGDDSEKFYPKQQRKKCHRCEKQCNNCDSCRSCNCDRCGDHTISDNSEQESGVCHGCDKHCNQCQSCKSCRCATCTDHSRSSVLSSLATSEYPSECPRFDTLANDQKKKCLKLGKSPKKDTPLLHSGPIRREKVHKEPVHYEPEKESSSVTSQLSDKKELLAYSFSSTTKGKKFVVTFKSKDGHQWAEYNDGNKSIHINGKNGPVLHLYRGCTYFFCVEQNLLLGEDAEHSLILTNNPAGGIGSRMIQNSFSPVPRGCVCLKVDDSTPRYFFYQDYKNAFAGGLVIVHDK